jgi:hypothetical protein
MNKINNKNAKDTIDGRSDITIAFMIRTALIVFSLSNDQVEKRIHKTQEKRRFYPEEYSIMTKDKTCSRIAFVWYHATIDEDYWDLFTTYVSGCLYLLDNEHLQDYEYNSAQSLLDNASSRDNRIKGQDKDAITNCLESLIRNWNVKL